MPTKVFVYGTLKVGGRLDRGSLKKARTSVENATIVGAIYSLGPYPTIKLDKEGEVVGEVHTFHGDDFDAILSTMDMIEGYNPAKPENGLYNRHVVSAKLEDGTTTEAWAYEYNGDVPEDKRIKSGVWSAKS
jgi:gamma-glutamylcyclotransferase (GGCT)/AIG2-like uncharacterized protein YtfP